MSGDISISQIEHPMDVMKAALILHEKDVATALVLIVGTQGGAVRARGTLMLVDEQGSAAGYVSGGCIDRDVALRAAEAIKTGIPQKLRYGAGSPFIDIQLPCGGAIDLLVLPNPDITVLRAAVQDLGERKRVALRATQTEFSYASKNCARPDTYHYRPKLNLRIAGRGAEPVALAKLADASGLNCSIWSPDTECLVAASDLNLSTRCHLTTPGNLPDHQDDRDTAFVLMFHDREWEAALLETALTGDAFFIGAVGSRATHEKRCAELRARGVSNDDIARIRGPVGMIPSMRDASMLAVSTLAEIVGAYHQPDGHR